MPRRLLLVDDVTTNRIVRKAKLMAAGYAVDVAKDEAGALASIERVVPDIVVISGTILASSPDRLPELFGTRGSLGRISVVVIKQIDENIRVGDYIDAVVPVDFSDSLVLARLRSVIRMRDLHEEIAMRAQTCREMGLAEASMPFRPKSHVLFASNKTEKTNALARRLDLQQNSKISVVQVGRLFNQLDQLGEAQVVVLDAQNDDQYSNLHTLSDLRCRPETRHASIIVRLPEKAYSAGAMAFDLGASDVIFGTSNPDDISAAIDQQIQHQVNLRHLKSQLNVGLRLAVVDPLTGLFNRRYAMSHLERLSERALQSSRKLGVMVADIDRFKSVNDTYGHQNGDRVIIAVAQCLKDNLRGGDMVARLGGEEFLITMPDTSTDEARAAAQRLCSTIEKLRIQISDGSEIGVTLSIGLSVQIPEGTTTKNCVEGMINKADTALYAAKAEGRNQVILGGYAA